MELIKELQDNQGLTDSGGDWGCLYVLTNDRSTLDTGVFHRSSVILGHSLHRRLSIIHTKGCEKGPGQREVKGQTNYTWGHVLSQVRCCGWQWYMCQVMNVPWVVMHPWDTPSTITCWLLMRSVVCVCCTRTHTYNICFRICRYQSSSTSYEHN